MDFTLKNPIFPFIIINIVIFIHFFLVSNKLINSLIFLLHTHTILENVTYKFCFIIITYKFYYYVYYFFNGLCSYPLVMGPIKIPSFRIFILILESIFKVIYYVPSEFQKSFFFLSIFHFWLKNSNCINNNVYILCLWFHFERDRKEGCKYSNEFLLLHF